MKVRRFIIFAVLFFIATAFAFGDTASPAGTTVYTFFYNVVYEPFPFPLIGFINNARGDHSLFQIGFVNLNTGNFTGLQYGFVNRTGENFLGLQYGFVNTTGGNFSGLQYGFVNTAANNVIGAQIGFVNVARQAVTGTQIGFINVADSYENGIPIGFLSFVRNGGYRAIEYSFTEFHPLTVGFKIGLEIFYSTIFAAYNPVNEFEHGGFATGLGFGSIIPIDNFFFFNPELNFLSSVSRNRASISYISFVPYFGINLGRFSIAAAPSVTWVHTIDVERLNRRFDVNIRSAEIPDPLFSLYTHNQNDYNRMVVGARVAARLRL